MLNHVGHSLLSTMATAGLASRSMAVMYMEEFVTCCDCFSPVPPVEAGHKRSALACLQLLAKRHAVLDGVLHASKMQYAEVQDC